MKSKWIIDLPGLELYRFDTHGELWKLAFTDAIGKCISLKKVKKDIEKKRWRMTRYEKSEWWSEHQLRPHLILDPNPFELTKENELPF